MEEIRSTRARTRVTRDTVMAKGLRDSFTHLGQRERKEGREGGRESSSPLDFGDGEFCLDLKLWSEQTVVGGVEK